MSVRGLYGNQGFQVPFRSMIYVPLKFKFNAIVGFRNRTSILIASKSWTRMECGILAPKDTPYQHFPNF